MEAEEQDNETEEKAAHPVRWPNLWEIKWTIGFEGRVQ